MAQVDYIFPERAYPSKVLLFGEHTIIMGSGALAMPFRRYNGRWNAHKKMGYKWWEPFIEYISNLQLSFINNDRLSYLKENAHLSLDIPIGYGLGSSGVLTAAIYDFTMSNDIVDLVELQHRLGVIESFFHGKSSGYDPLISYLNKRVRKSTTGKMSSWAPNGMKDIHCYLVDSGCSRAGKDMIAQVQELATEDSSMFERIAELNNQVITSYCDDAHSEELFNGLNQLSIEQFDKMSFLITPSIRELWRSTLDRENIALKICGAGGGGYYLLFSKEAIGYIGDWELQEVYLG